MLIALSITNLAVIESVQLQFHQGFHVLTGETGAGKSIIIDALGLIGEPAVPRNSYAMAAIGRKWRPPSICPQTIRHGKLSRSWAFRPMRKNCSSFAGN